LQLVEQGEKPFALFVCENTEPQPKAEWWCLVGDLAPELKPLAIRQLQLEREDFTDLRFAETIDVTATFRQVCDAGVMVSAFTIPHRIETNIPSLFGSAVAHW